MPLQAIRLLPPLPPWPLPHALSSGVPRQLVNALSVSSIMPLSARNPTNGTPRQTAGIFWSKLRVALNALPLIRLPLRLPLLPALLLRPIRPPHLFPLLRPIKISVLKLLSSLVLSPISMPRSDGLGGCGPSTFSGSLPQLQPTFVWIPVYFLIFSRLPFPSFYSPGFPPPTLPLLLQVLLPLFLCLPGLIGVSVASTATVGGTAGVVPFPVFVHARRSA
jgi:hypothetical protein